MPHGVVFDMDGTLLESEKLARSCFLRACTDVGWPDVDVGVYDQCVGATHAATRELLISGYGREFPIDDLLVRWSERYHAHIEQYPLDIKPGVLKLLEELASRGVPMAVATSSLRPTTETKLNMAGLRPYFDHLVCGGEAEYGKPDPAPYLKAAALIGVAPHLCWGLEDSDNGLKSAHAAGLQVIQIPDEIHPSDEVRKIGHPILTSVQTLVDYLTED
ncbi:MAG: HAD family phosphatase [Pseudomonadota bacterium]